MSDHRDRLRRTLWATAVFLLAFAVLIVIVARYFLVPALDAARDADATGKRQLSAVSMLLMAVVLFTLLVGLLMTFRLHRYFFPRQTGPPARTPHVDAWAESAKRVNVPKSENEEDWDELE